MQFVLATTLVVEELHSVTKVVVADSIAQSRIQFYFLQHNSAACQAIAQCITTPATCFTMALTRHDASKTAQFENALH